MNIFWDIRPERYNTVNTSIIYNVPRWNCAVSACVRVCVCMCVCVYECACVCRVHARANLRMCVYEQKKKEIVYLRCSKWWPTKIHFKIFYRKHSRTWTSISGVTSMQTRWILFFISSGVGAVDIIRSFIEPQKKKSNDIIIKRTDQLTDPPRPLYFLGNI